MCHKSVNRGISSLLVLMVKSSDGELPIEVGWCPHQGTSSSHQGGVHPCQAQWHGCLFRVFGKRCSPTNEESVCCSCWAKWHDLGQLQVGAGHPVQGVQVLEQHGQVPPCCGHQGRPQARRCHSCLDTAVRKFNDCQCVKTRSHDGLVVKSKYGQGIISTLPHLLGHCA